MTVDGSGDHTVRPARRAHGRVTCQLAVDALRVDRTTGGWVACIEVMPGCERPVPKIRSWTATVIAIPSSFDPSRTLGRRRGADPLTGSNFAATAAVAGARKRSQKERGYDRGPR